MSFLTFPIKLLLGGTGTVGVAATTVLLAINFNNSSNRRQPIERAVQHPQDQDSTENGLNKSSHEGQPIETWVDHQQTDHETTEGVATHHEKARLEEDGGGAILY